MASSSQTAKHVLFLIPSLKIGGAERQLVLLALGLLDRCHKVTVFTLYSDKSLLRSELIEAGVEVVSLNKKGRWDIWGFFVRLRSNYNRVNPDFCYSFMPTANLFSFAMKLTSCTGKFLYGVRAGEIIQNKVGFLSHWLQRISAFFLFSSDLTIFNSLEGRKVYEKMSLFKLKSQVIFNGIDCEQFSLKTHKHYDNSVLKLGMVARVDPLKHLRV